MRKSIYILVFLALCIQFPIAQVSQQWVARYSGPGNNYDKANKIIVDAAGNIYVTGSVAVTPTNWDYLTIKYNSSGVQQWIATYNGPANYHDQAYSIALDNSGNVYVTGGSFGNGTERDFCTIKYSSNGDSLWVRRYNGPGNDIDEAVCIVADASGNVYAAGYSDDGINLDYFTIKYNASGVQQWAARYNFPASGTGSEDRLHYMTVDGSGNVYITGESSTGFGFIDMYATVKYNSSGQQQWVARYKGPGDSTLSQAYSLAVDVNGSVYVTGRSDPASAFGSNFDILTIKYSSSGDSLWVKRYNGPGNSSDVGNAIILDGAGNVLVTGLSVQNTSSDYFTIKYSSSGSILWTARYNGPANGVDAATSIAIDGSSNIYITGFSTGSGTLRDYATIKYNSSGVQQWAERYNGPGTNNDEALSITGDGLGNVYITGMSTGINSSMDIATIKYSQPVGVHQVSIEIPKQFSLSQNYPNPFNPTTKIRFSLPLNVKRETSNVKLIVFDILGCEAAMLVNEPLSPGTYEIEWETSGYSSGVYYYRLQTESYTETKKMVLVN